MAKNKTRVEDSENESEVESSDKEKIQSNLIYINLLNIMFLLN